MALIGLNDAIRNLDQAIEGIEGRTFAGVTKAIMLIRRNAQQITPVRTGNLRASYYVVAGHGDKQVADSGDGPNKFDFRRLGKNTMMAEHQAHVAARKANLPSEARNGPYAETGVTAGYGAAVHENVGATFREGSAKFLEKSVRFLSGRALDIIRGEAAVK